MKTKEMTLIYLLILIVMILLGVQGATIGGTFEEIWSTSGDEKIIQRGVKRLANQIKLFRVMGKLKVSHC